SCVQASAVIERRRGDAAALINRATPRRESGRVPFHFSVLTSPAQGHAGVLLLPVSYASISRDRYNHELSSEISTHGPVTGFDLMRARSFRIELSEHTRFREE